MSDQTPSDPASDWETAAEICSAELGPPARLVSLSKSMYRETHPDHLVIFNATVCLEGLGKTWYGDLDLTLDEPKLVRLAARTGRIAYVLHEMDGRFQAEQAPHVERALYSATPTGHYQLRADAALRNADGEIRRRLPPPQPRFRRPNRPHLWKPWHLELRRQSPHSAGANRSIRLFLGQDQRAHRPLLIISRYEDVDRDGRSIGFEWTWYPAGGRRWAPSVAYGRRRRHGRIRPAAGFQAHPGLIWEVWVELGWIGRFRRR